MEALVFFIAGAIVSYIISYLFYKRGAKEKPSWFNIDTIKSIISKHPEDIDWTAKEIVKLYKNKVVGEQSDGPLPDYNFCPECGHDKLSRGTHNDHEHDEVYYWIECPNCNWSDWSQ